ncbi:response regulator [Pedobacter cryophilus]|uniref:Response regulator n=1 Tax=Pedobacter cryophilus TaxID=2571271 RepID=A0A4V5NWS3_9SPHI|nr:response regulator [Pedobacter cryophilus]TKB96060.1 response regulator [Pedobacter cryophilus]
MKTILLLEDNPLVRDNIAEILTINGFEVIETNNGKEGLNALKERLPDLILCDIMMPVINGHEFLIEIKKNELTAKIPFIFISAISEKKEIKYSLGLGANDYVTKPFEQDELIEKINKWLPK